MKSHSVSFDSRYRQNSWSLSRAWLLRGGLNQRIHSSISGWDGIHKAHSIKPMPTTNVSGTTERNATSLFRHTIHATSIRIAVRTHCPHVEVNEPEFRTIRQYLLPLSSYSQANTYSNLRSGGSGNASDQAAAYICNKLGEAMRHPASKYRCHTRTNSIVIVSDVGCPVECRDAA
jgi:hypothetical protein